MKIAFINNKCHLTGVDTALKNRIDLLQQFQVECSMVFLEHGFEEETFKNLHYIVADSEEKFNRAIEECDVVVTVIVPESLMRKLCSFGKPIIYECHACGPYTYLEKLATYGVSAVIFPSRVCFDEAVQYIPEGIKCFIIPNCPPHGKAEQTAENNKTDLIPLLWVGRLEKNKNWMLLINLARELKDGYLIRVITDVSFDREYSIFIDILNKENLENKFDIIMNCPNEQMQLWYSISAAQGCYISSSYKEAFGMTLIEAMNVKCPMVISDIPVFREVAGEGALYFEPEDYKRCIDQIYSICEDKELRCMKINELSKRFDGHYHGNVISREYLDTIIGIKQAYIPRNIDIKPTQAASIKPSASGRLASKTISLSSGKLVMNDNKMELLQ